MIAADSNGLLTVKPKKTARSSEDKRLVEAFDQIVVFVRGAGALPSPTSDNLSEKSLAARLDAIRRDPKHRSRLEPFDELGLLRDEGESLPITTYATMDELLHDPLIAADDDDPSSIFKLVHVRRPAEYESPDYVAQRKRCADFEQFRQLFVDCQAELRAGARKVIPFANEQQIEQGKFYILRGVLLNVAEIGERTTKKKKHNARLRCVFENGTESDMLLRSLAAELYKAGARVTELEEDLLKNMQGRQPTGFIYVLRSLSSKPGVKSVPDLHKIGLARQSIKGRLKNARNEPTYLMADVQLVQEFQCFDQSLSKLESLLHRFFSKAQVRIEVRDHSGKISTPKEWFSVPVGLISQAVMLLQSGDIVNHEYVPMTHSIRRVK